MAEARAAVGPLTAVVTLREAGSEGSLDDPEGTGAMTAELLRRVEAAVGQGAEDVNVFRNLRSFAVVASPDFLAELLDQPEVEAATAGRRIDQLQDPR